MKSNNNNNDDDDDDDDDNNNNNNNNTAMGSVHARGRYIFNFWFKSAYRNEHLMPRHCRIVTGMNLFCVEQEHNLLQHYLCISH
jgi:hypothetical protein